MCLLVRIYVSLGHIFFSVSYKIATKLTAMLLAFIISHSAPTRILTLLQQILNWTFNANSLFTHLLQREIKQ